MLVSWDKDRIHPGEKGWVELKIDRLRLQGFVEKRLLVKLKAEDKEWIEELTVGCRFQGWRSRHPKMFTGLKGPTRLGECF